jgi:hypothetical protein
MKRACGTGVGGGRVGWGRKKFDQGFGGNSQRKIILRT